MSWLFIDEQCNGVCKYSCTQIEVKLLNSDVVARISICKYRKLLVWELF